LLQEEDVNELHELVLNLHSLSRDHCSMNWQKSRLRWLQEGDENSKFFHGVMLARCRRNKIQMVNVNGAIVEGVHNVRQAVFNHYSNHFRAQNVSRPGVDNLPFRKLSFVEAGNLTKPFSEADVKQAVWDCDSYKSLGPDGVNFGFIKQFWDLMKVDFMRFLVEFHRNGKLTKGVNSTFIALIPKVNSPQHLNDFRPISLIGCMYKVLAKVLANRLREVLGSVISKSQSAFVKGQQILDGILVANEAVDEARRFNKELLMFKVDFEKAYDSVDLSYLDSVMCNMNFPTLWRKWISECVGTATASILVNGCPTDEFKIERGLRQGDPLSPFLFLIAAEGFNVLMQALVEAQLYKGYRVGREGEVRITHLEFADDTLILGEKSWLNVRSMRAVLLLFENISSLKVNFHKSMLTGVNVNDSWLREAALVLNCRRGIVPFVYLGLPIGGNSTKLSFWKPVIDRVVARLSSWNNKFLSFGGRLILLKFVLSSLPIYFLSFFKAPAGIISLIESLFKRFFWGGSEENKKIAWIKWDDICVPKEDGGLGVRRLSEFNVSLLGKWCWRLLVDKEGLWYQVLKARYGEEGGRVREAGRHSSLWWRMVCKVRGGAREGEGNWFEGNVRRQVGDGIGTLFWFDHWIGEMPLRFKFPRLFDLVVNKMCSVADMKREGWEEGGRAWVWRRRLLAWEEESVRECSLLLFNVVLQANASDSWRWLSGNAQDYSVKEAYRLISNNGVQLDRSRVVNVWHRHIPAKVSLFVWRLLRNRIPTRCNLLRRNIIQENNSNCVHGCEIIETAVHLFLGCGNSVTLWSLVSAWLGLPMVLHIELRQHFNQFCFMAGLPRSTHAFFTGIWYATVWEIWKDRNNRIFHNEETHVLGLLEKVKRISVLWMKARNLAFVHCYYDWWVHPLLCMGVF